MYLSIIIPAYNVEFYINDCIKTIVDQINNPNQVEIIIVDDGSPDKSGAIADHFAQKYSFIKVLHKENGGLSSARNAGLKIAHGSFVWFVDSDDWIPEGSLDKLMTIIKQNNNLDAIAIEANNVFEKHEESHFSIKKGTPLITNGISLLENNAFSCCVPFTVYNRNFLLKNNLWLKEGIYHEDLEFTPRAYYYLDTIYSLKECLYKVRQNPNSITRTFKSKKNFDLLIVASSLELFQKLYVDNKYKYIFSRMISRSLNNSFKNVHLFSKELKKDYFNKLGKDIINHYLKSKSIKYLIIGIGLMINRRYCVDFLSKH